MKGMASTNQQQTPWHQRAAKHFGAVDKTNATYSEGVSKKHPGFTVRFEEDILPKATIYHSKSVLADTFNQLVIRQDKRIEIQNPETINSVGHLKELARAADRAYAALQHGRKNA